MGWNEFWSNWWDGCQIIGGNLQNAYENGIIKEQDLSEIEKQELFQLYNV